MSAATTPVQGLSLTDPRCAAVLNALPGLSPQQRTPAQLAQVEGMRTAAHICEAQKRTLDPYNDMAAHIWALAFDQCAAAIRAAANTEESAS